MARTMMRFNLAGLDRHSEQARLHATMLDLAVAADDAGVGEVSVNEHHATPSGGATSPLLLASALLARTREIVVSVSALLLPLHDPVRVAESVATLDAAYPGRLRVTVALGYRREEYELYGRDFTARGRLMDEALDRLLTVWTSDLPVARPVSTPAAIMAVGGERPVAARRAARFGLAFAPRARLSALAAQYEAACREHGHEASTWLPTARFVQLHVAEDPQRVWDLVGRHYLADASTYASMQPDAVRSPVYASAQSVEELRRSGAVLVATPEEAVAVASAPDTTTCLHPLAGGMPDDEARRSVELFCTRVMPRLASA